MRKFDVQLEHKASTLGGDLANAAGVETVAEGCCVILRYVSVGVGVVVDCGDAAVARGDYQNAWWTGAVPQPDS